MKTAVFDARWIKPTPSGIGVYAQELAARLPVLLPDWSFVFLCHDPIAKAALLKELPKEAEGRMSTLTLPYGPLSPKNQLLLPAVLRGIRADLYHAPNYMIPFSAFPKNRRGRIRCLATIHDVIPLVVPDYAPSSRTSRLRGVFRFCLRQAALRSDALLTVSECSKRDIATSLNLPEAARARIHAVLNGVDDAFRAVVHAPVKPAGDATPRTLLYVGRMDPYKNVPLLVEAFAEAQAKAPFPMRLRIVGAHDPRYPEAADKARERGVAGMVEFTGSLPYRDLVDAYRTADLLVHPSRYEGFGLQIAEAMTCGLPVVCTDGGSAPEVAGQAAKIVPLAQGAKGLADTIVSFLSDPESLRWYRMLGLDRAKAFTWDRAAREIAAFYHAD